MGSSKRFSLAAFLFTLCMASNAWATGQTGPDIGLKRCLKVTAVTDTSTAADTLTSLSTVPSIVCSVEFRANVALGWYELFDAASGLETDSNVNVVSERGEATLGNSDSSYFGTEGRLTVWGLAARVRDGVLIVHWDN